MGIVSDCPGALVHRRAQ